MKYFKHSFKFNKKGINFLSIISIIGFIFGSIFILIITNSDKTLVKEYISSYIKSTNNIDYIPILFNNCNDLGPIPLTLLTKVILPPHFSTRHIIS